MMSPGRIKLLPVTTLAIFALVAHGRIASAAKPNPHEALLRGMGVSTTADGIRQYLEQLHPNKQQQQRIAKLIEQLSNKKFATREAASAQLAQLPALPAALLQAAVRGGDPEVAWRAQELLKTGRSRSRQLLYAVFRTIEHQQLKGLADQILKATPFCDDSHLRRAARLALVATSRDEDVRLLRRSLKHEDPHIRRAAVSALAEALGDRRVDDMLPLLEHEDERMRLEAARALANIGDRRSLAALGKLLLSDDLELRVQTAGLLRAVTKQPIVFTAYEKPEVRGRQAANWQTWIDGAGRAAKLHFPISGFAAAEIGHTFVSLYRQHKVVELDAEGKEIRTITGGQGPWGAEPLPNGNVLVNWFSNHSVVEYDRQGKEIWKWAAQGVQYAWSAQRLDDGNTLIACRNVVLEVDPDGETIWQTKLGIHHSHALRLANGNTLISVQNTNGKVVEVDREGKVVWEIAGLRNPYRLQRLANGNTLVAEKGRNRVVEFDPSGKKEVWSRDGFSSPDSAQRLQNGNTLVSDGQAIYEVDPAGKIVWQKPYAKSIICRY